MRFLVLLLVLLGLSCSNDNNEIFDINSFDNCKEGLAKDASLLRSELMGKWSWIESSCSFCIDSKPRKADKLVIAQFNTDKTFLVTEDSETISEGVWSIEESNDIFYISLDPITPYLDGSIRICKDQLISDARPWDGGAYLFVREN